MKENNAKSILQVRGSILAFAILCLSCFASFSMAAPPDTVIPGRYIVQLKPDVAPESVIVAHGVKPDFVYRSVVRGFAGVIPPGQLRALRADPAVLTIAPDHLVQAIAKPAGTKKPQPEPGQVVPAGVARIGGAPADDSLTGAGVGVAVVDTGLDLQNADLPVAEASFTAYGDSAQDDNGHGTHVGGIIAAENNSIGVVGVAPGATLYAVKVLDSSGSGYDSTIIDGLDWVFENRTLTPPIQVVNMSLGRAGTLTDDDPLQSAIQNLYTAGIAVVVAAGNNAGLEVSQQVPATYPEVFAIASTTALNGASTYRFYPEGIPADTASYFTTDGKYVGGIGVTISAPGEEREDINRAGSVKSVGILSTAVGGGTVRMSGTSMAAPHVSGVLARFFQENNASTATDIETLRGLLRTNANGIGAAPRNSPTSGYSFDGEREGVVLVPDLWDKP